MNPLRLILSLFLIVGAMQVQSDDTVTLNGRILANGHQAHSVWIGVFELPMRPEAEAWSWTQLDSTEFTLNVPDAKEIQLVALRKDSLPVVQRIHPGSADARIELEFKEGLTLEGNVLSTDGIPVADIWLILYRPDLPNVQIPRYVKPSWKSEADGRFKIGGLVANESYEIEIALRYSANETFSVKISENNPVHELRLSDAYFVRGRVIDLDQDLVQGSTVSFEPVPETRDFFSSDQFGPDAWSPTTTTDDKGEFGIGPFERGKKIWLIARHTEHGPSNVLQVDSGEHRAELVLKGMVRVFGSVVDASTGEPIDEFTLFAIRADGSQKYSFDDSKGEISSLVEPKTVGLVVDSPEYSVHFGMNISMESVDEYDMGVIALNRARQLTGLVYDSASREPLAGAAVSHFDNRLIENVETHWLNFIPSYLSETTHSTTNEVGEFLLTRVAGDSTQLTVTAAGYLTQVHQIDGGTTEFDVALVKKSTSARIRGRIESNLGEPIAGDVEFVGANERHSVGVQSDGLFDHAVSPDKYEVYAETNQGRSDTLEVDVAEDEVQEITLVVDSKGHLIGAVDGLWDGETVYVSIYSKTDEVHLGSLSELGNGKFEVVGVGLGELRISAWSNRGRTQQNSIEVNTDTQEAFVELNFRGTSRIFGSLSFPGGSIRSGHLNAVPKLQGKTGGSGAINVDGTYEITGLDDGEYTVHVYQFKRLSLELEDRGFGGGGTVPVGRFDAFVRGDTELDLALPKQFKSE
ncbi:MAG: carboxypeptidase-like regulatory domain-containing protein [Gammaproteobacteria bacterium]|nr:carboxypeptidase-like regulatory domain-containing protein [Gammaproteobacteria bacterium]